MIENTTNRDPLLHILGASSDGVNGYIEGMEAAGQSQLVHSDLLPARTQGCGAQHLEALGIVLGGVVDGDPLFRHVTLPPNLRQDGSDHAMGSFRVDEHGRRRASMFYKAAWYDRDAFIRVETIEDYLYRVLGTERAPLILDDSWATRERVLEELDRQGARQVEEAARFDQIAAECEADDPERAGHCRDYAAEHRVKARKCKALRDKVEAGEVTSG